MWHKLCLTNSVYPLSPPTHFFLSFRVCGNLFNVWHKTLFNKQCLPFVPADSAARKAGDSLWVCSSIVASTGRTVFTLCPRDSRVIFYHSYHFYLNNTTDSTVPQPVSPVTHGLFFLDLGFFTTGVGIKYPCGSKFPKLLPNHVFRNIHWNNFLPLCTAKVKPTASGVITDRRDQVL